MKKQKINKTTKKTINQSDKNTNDMLFKPINYEQALASYIRSHYTV